ncbi:MAG: prepilin peptidase [Clostridia bacterium]|nr:prepilin peptidase [Clostridia bacterium]
MIYRIVRCLAAAICGLVMGAYTNTLEYRLRSGMSMVEKDCHCTSCGCVLQLRDQIPLLSWLMLRGRCRNCGAPISPRYPLVEGGVMLLYLLAALLTAPRVIPVLCVGAVGILAYIAISLAVRGCFQPNRRWLSGAGMIAYYQLLIGVILTMVNIALG